MARAVPMPSASRARLCTPCWGGVNPGVRTARGLSNGLGRRRLSARLRWRRSATRRRLTTRPLARFLDDGALRSRRRIAERDRRPPAQSPTPCPATHSEACIAYQRVAGTASTAAACLPAVGVFGHFSRGLWAFVTLWKIVTRHDGPSATARSSLGGSARSPARLASIVVVANSKDWMAMIRLREARRSYVGGADRPQPALRRDRSVLTELIAIGANDVAITWIARQALPNVERLPPHWRTWTSTVAPPSQVFPEGLSQGTVFCGLGEAHFA